MGPLGRQVQSLRLECTSERHGWEDVGLLPPVWTIAQVRAPSRCLGDASCCHEGMAGRDHRAAGEGRASSCSGVGF